MGKRGPRGVAIADLLFWEQLWYYVFKGLRDGFPKRPIVGSPPFKVPPRPKELPFPPVNYERLKEWNRKKNEAWNAADRQVRDFTKGVPAERHLWEELKSAKPPVEVRSIYRRSLYWLNPKWEGKTHVVLLADHPLTIRC